MRKRKVSSHKRESVKSSRKSQYLTKDTMTLRVAVYLNSKKDKGATVYNIIHDKSLGFSTQDQTRFTKVIIEPMVENDWIEKIEYGKRMTVYKITEKGTNAVQEALDLCKNNSLISSLDSFQGLIR